MKDFDKLLKKVKKELAEKLEGYHLIDNYSIHGKEVFWFTNNSVNMYVLTSGYNILDIQID